MLAALAEFERSLIVERTQAGLKAASQEARGEAGATICADLRSRTISSPMRALLDKGESLAAVARLLNVCRATLCNSMKRPT